MRKGKFGNYGGQYVNEILMPILIELELAFEKYYPKIEFQKKFNGLLKDYAGRPTSLYYAKNFSKLVDCKVYLKREEK